MRKIRLLLPCALVLCASAAYSEEPPRKPQQVEPVTPLPEPARPAAPALMPEEIPARVREQLAPTLPTLPRRDMSAPRMADITSDADMRIRYAKARNLAEADAKVRAAWEESREARTDFEKRDALKRYEDLLCAKMIALDRRIEPLVKQRRDARRALLEQRNIAPTVAPQ